MANSRIRVASWLLLVAAFAVAVSALITTRALYDNAERAQSEQVHLTRVESLANRLSAVEWQAMAEESLSPGLRSEADAALEETRTLLDGVVAGSDENDSQVVALHAAFSAAVQEELDLIGAGDVVAARALDEETVDPSFADLRYAIATEISRETRVTDAARAKAHSLSIVTMAVGMGLVALLFWRFERARRTVDVARVEQRALRRLAFHDSLTGLPNRRVIEDGFGGPLNGGGGRPLAILYIDVDDFKQANDALGHEVGDRLLRSIAGRLQSVVREGDTIARMGGDEFVMVLPEADPKWAETVARRALAALQDPFLIDGLEVAVTASIGISVSPDGRSDMRSLLRMADAAMYGAKDAGRNRYEFAVVAGARDQQPTPSR